MSELVEEILVIKLGDLRSFVEATPAMRSIRAAHTSARITLLTSAPLDRMAPDTPYFDVVETLERLSGRRGVAFAARQIKRAKFARIYDLDRSETSSRLFSAMRPFPPCWCGPQAGAKIRFKINPEDYSNDADGRVRCSLDQIAAAGVPTLGAPTSDMTWLERARPDTPSMQPAYFGLREPYVLLVASREGDEACPRWSQQRFGELAALLAHDGVSVGVAADPGDNTASSAVARAHQDVRDLANRADLTQIATLARGASVVFGHADSGVLHMAAPTGASIVALVTSADEEAAAQVPNGPSVVTLTAESLEGLSADYVATFFRTIAGVSAPTQPPVAVGQ